MHSNKSMAVLNSPSSPDGRLGGGAPLIPPFFSSKQPMQMNGGVLVQDKRNESERPLATLCAALLCSEILLEA